MTPVGNAKAVGMPLGNAKAVGMPLSNAKAVGMPVVMDAGTVKDIGVISVLRLASRSRLLRRGRITTCQRRPTPTFPALHRRGGSMGVAGFATTMTPMAGRCADDACQRRTVPSICSSGQGHSVGTGPASILLNSTLGLSPCEHPRPRVVQTGMNPGSPRLRRTPQLLPRETWPASCQGRAWPTRMSAFRP